MTEKWSRRPSKVNNRLLKGWLDGSFWVTKLYNPWFHFQVRNCRCGKQNFEKEPQLISRSINFAASAIKDNQDAHSQAERKTAHLRSQLFWFQKKIHVDTSHPVRIKRQSSCHTSTPRKILNAEYHEVLGIIWFQSHIDIRRPSEASRDPSATASRLIFHDLLRP